MLFALFFLLFMFVLFLLLLLLLLVVVVLPRCEADVPIHGSLAASVRARHVLQRTVPWRNPMQGDTLQCSPAL